MDDGNSVTLDMGRSSKRECFSWAKRLVRQAVQRILDTVLCPSLVTQENWAMCLIDSASI